MCPIQANKGISAVRRKGDDVVVDNDRKEKRDSASPSVGAGERHPGAGPDDPEASRRRLEEANAKWQKAYEEEEVNDDGCDMVDFSAKKSKTKKKKKFASFSSPDSWRLIPEDPALSEALRESRRSDLARRKADLARMERALAPVLEPRHRERVYKRLYGGKES